MKNERLRACSGQLLMLAAAVCFSGGGVLCKLVPWSAFAINGVRSLVAAAVLGTYLLVRRHRVRVNRSVLIGAVCYAGVTTLFILANKLTTAANAIILQYTAPVWIILILALRYRRKPTRLEVGTVCVVLFGILCFFFDSLGGGGLAGDIVAILSGVCYAGMFLLNDMEGGDALSSLLLGQLGTGIVLAPLAARETDFSPTVLVAVFLLGAVQIGLAYICFCEGTTRTPPVAACLIAAVEPILNPILVAIVFGETLAPLSFLGALIVIGGIVFYQVRQAGAPDGKG